jgi:Transglutaminase-like superfamily
VKRGLRATLRISAARACLAGEVLWTYRQVRLALRGNDLREALASLRRAGPRSPFGPALPVRDAARLGRAVLRTVTFFRLDSRCLTQALVLDCMLARRQMASAVVIGVRPGETFGAHAWVEHDGQAVGQRGLSEFPRLIAL